MARLAKRIVALGPAQVIVRAAGCCLTWSGGPAFHLRRSDEQSVRNRYPGICRVRVGGRASADNTSYHPSRKRHRRLARTRRPAAAASGRTDGMVGWAELCPAQTNNL